MVRYAGQCCTKPLVHNGLEMVVSLEPNKTTNVIVKRRGSRTQHEAFWGPLRTSTPDASFIFPKTEEQ